MDPETQERFFELLKKTAADVIADWKWPTWRPESDEPLQRDQ